MIMFIKIAIILIIIWLTEMATCAPIYSYGSGPTPPEVCHNEMTEYSVQQGPPAPKTRHILVPAHHRTGRGDVGRERGKKRKLFQLRPPFLIYMAIY